MCSNEDVNIELKNAYLMHTAIFEGSLDAIFISDTESGLTLVNNAACLLTGYSKDELLKMKIPELHEHTDLDAYKTYHGRIMDGEKLTTAAKILRKDGRKLDVEFSNSQIMINKSYFYANHSTQHNKA